MHCSPRRPFPSGVLIQDRNCTEGWLGPMWSSPSRYFDTCNLIWSAAPHPQSFLKSLYPGKKLHKKTPGFFVIHLQQSGVGLRKTSVFVGGPYGAHPTHGMACCCQFCQVVRFACCQKSHHPIQQSQRPLPSGKQIIHSARPFNILKEKFKTISHDKS